MIYTEETLQEDNTDVARFIKLSTAQKYYQLCLIALNAEFTTVNSTQLNIDSKQELTGNIRKKRSLHFL